MLIKNAQTSVNFYIDFKFFFIYTLNVFTINQQYNVSNMVRQSLPGTLNAPTTVVEAINLIQMIESVSPDFFCCCVIEYRKKEEKYGEVF